MKNLYFARKDGALIDSDQIKSMALVVFGKRLETDAEIRSFAKKCKHISYEVKKPSIKYLLKNGYKLRAIIVCKELNNISFHEAEEIVKKIEKTL